MMKPDTSLSRRNFLKTFALTTAYAGGCATVGKLFMTEIYAQSSGGVGILKVNLSSFTALQSTNGSILLIVPGMSTATFPKIIITRLANDQFFAVTSKCTHTGCTVGTFNGTSLTCPCHLSRFTAAGVVINGPAPLPLTSYPTTFTLDADHPAPGSLAIQIDGLGYTTSGALVGANAGKRFQLVFPTVSGWKYGIRFRAALGTGSDAPVFFATALDGTANQTTLSGDGTNKTVFVDPPTDKGFYSVITTP